MSLGRTSCVSVNKTSLMDEVGNLPSLIALSEEAEAVLEDLEFYDVTVHADDLI